MTNVDIRAAVADAQQQLDAAFLERTVITKSALVAMTVNAIERAAETGKLAAHLSHLRLLCRLLGFLPERRQTRVIHSIADLTDDELARLVRPQQDASLN